MTEPTEYPIPLPVTPKMADRMRAAGWRPPARVIETEAELAALGDWTVIRDADNELLEREIGRWYFGDGQPRRVTLPATVLWEPGE